MLILFLHAASLKIKILKTEFYSSNVFSSELPVSQTATCFPKAACNDK